MGTSSVRLERKEYVMVVSEIMSVDPFVVTVTESIRRTMLKLMEADIRHLPVLDQGMLVGIVSDRDLSNVNRLIVAGEGTGGGNLLDRPISDVMSSDVISLNPESELQEVIDLMTEHKIGAIPIVEADSLKLVGIVSYIDVLRAAREAL